MTPARVLASAVAVWLLASAGAADAQFFLSERATPELTVGPLFVRTTVTPALGALTVDILFGLVVPPEVTVAGLEQDLFLVWPGALVPAPDMKPPEPALAEIAAGHGFTVIGEGRVQLRARNLFAPRDDDARSQPIGDGASFVTYVRENAAVGLSAPATLIRMPWDPRFVNRTFLIGLRMTTRDLLRAKPATWAERTFWGPRHRIMLGFHDVRPRAVLPMYLRSRQRVLKLADDPAQITVNFAEADRLKIDEMAPQSAQRRLSDSLDNTDAVSLFMDRGDGLTPQVLAIQFGYFSGLQSWAPILIPFLFFVLGNLAAPIIRELGLRGGRVLAARIAFGQAGRGVPMDSGVIVPRETLARIVPGETRYDDVLRLAGPFPDEHEQIGAPDRKTLVYRGRRAVPHRRRRFGWFATVASWDVEHHEVEIDVEGGVVRDVQARVRRTHPASPVSS